MSNSDEAERAARADWTDRSALFRVCGTLASDLPQLTASRPLYTVSLGSAASPEDHRWAASYNQAIPALLEEHGVPEWAPWRRVPSREECLLRLARDAVELSSLPLSIAVRRGVAWLVRAREARGRTSQRFAHHEDDDVVIIGGAAGPRAGDVDCLDARDGRYMVNYQYRRRHVANFPWE